MTHYRENLVVSHIVFENYSVQFFTFIDPVSRGRIWEDILLLIRGKETQIISEYTSSWVITEVQLKLRFKGLGTGPLSIRVCPSPVVACLWFQQWEQGGKGSAKQAG